MLFSCILMATVGVKGLTWTGQEYNLDAWLINAGLWNIALLELENMPKRNSFDADV